MSADRFRDAVTLAGARRGLRVAFAALLALTLLSAGHSFVTYDPVASATPDAGGGANATATATAAAGGSPPPADPRVVATVDGVGPGQIVAYDGDGNVVYHNESWWLYHDVDPSPAGKHTVTYVASGPADSDTCDGDSCLRNAIERVNLSTGNVTSVHAWSDARRGSTQTHDVDRINESVFLVADISFPDRVYMVNVTSGDVIWQWRVSEAFDRDSGGDYPSDWTHINDVEHLEDGRVMANLRNQDQVVFIEPGRGIQPNWTLGADDDHATLFEAHNPDYIPAERGGPAVVVADSENNRLVEYQRTDGQWERSWRWQDVTMQWPRDADRLPSGRTLVADSHGQRIMSVRPDGRIAWSRPFPTGSYDVEVLGTGDESAGGESAARLGLESRAPGSYVISGNTSMAATSVGPSVADRASPGDGANGTSATGNGSDAGGSDGTAAGADSDARAGVPGTVRSGVALLVHGVVSLVPPLVLHGLLFALPTWVTAVDATLLVGTALVGACWGSLALGARIAPRVPDRWRP